MARMHSGKKGKSGSNRPLQQTTKSWIRHKPKEVETLIVKLAKEGHTASTIGLALRDNYGVPRVKEIAGKTITHILKERGVAKELPEDLMALIKKAIAVRKHLEENRQDQVAKRGVQLTDSKIRRLVKYYKRNEVLPAAWKYDVKNLKMYIE
ncbi:MAG: 30S ribosomal protein S15 [Candidatus Woesearchaeota archaeon]|nr:30S ribosomal protein S15 [Candidatus Woesearchaeota archaeon]